LRAACYHRYAEHQISNRPHRCSRRPGRSGIHREAASLSTLVANTVKAVETFELADRLAKLEEQVGTRGSNP
jgi:hypothetical protein